MSEIIHRDDKGFDQKAQAIGHAIIELMRDEKICDECGIFEVGTMMMFLTIMDEIRRGDGRKKGEEIVDSMVERAKRKAMLAEPLVKVEENLRRKPK